MCERGYRQNFASAGPKLSAAHFSGLIRVHRYESMKDNVWVYYTKWAFTTRDMAKMKSLILTGLKSRVR